MNPLPEYTTKRFLSFRAFSGSVYGILWLSVCQYKCTKIRDVQNTCAMFVGFLYITYFCALVLM